MTRDYAAPDWRGLCAELLVELENCIAVHYGEGGTHHISAADAVIAKADAALAQPEPEVVGPSDEELLELYPVTMVDHQDAFTFARAVLARYAHQPAPPAEGEVAELVDRLRRASDGASAMGWEQDSWTIARAAELLERQAAPVPVPAEVDCPACEGLPKQGNQPCAVCGRSALSAEGEVAELAWWLRSLEDASVWFESGSPEALKLTRAADLLEQRHPAPVPVAERLPGPEDCDAEGRCWLHLPDMGTEPLWRLTDPSMRSRYHSHWLPAHALPLPSGEVG